MRDRPHVGLVDAHAERVRGHHHLRAALHERLLARASCIGIHARVVGHRRDLLRGDLLGQRIGVFARAAVHDRRARARLAEHVQQCSPLARHRALALDADDIEDEVRPVKARAHRHPVAQPEPRRDLARDPRRGRRRDRHHRRPVMRLELRGRGAVAARAPEARQGRVFDAVQRGDRLAQAQVVGPEVVSPLAHAVRLIHNEQRHRPPRQRRAECARGEALGGSEHELRLPRFDL